MKNVFLKTFILTILYTTLFIAGLHASEFGEVDIHGFISQGYLKSDENNFLADTKDGTFQFNETGLNFGTWLTPKLRAGLQFFARDIGEFGNDEIEVDWAYADYKFKKWLGMRIGKIKSPMGLYNESRDMDMLRVNIFLPQGVYNEGWRDSVKSAKGMGIYGIASIGILGVLDYQAQMGIMDIPVGGGIAKYINSMVDSTGTSFDNIKTNTIASLQWETPLSGLRLGATGRWFDFDSHYTTNDGYFWQQQGLHAGYSIDVDMPVENFYYVVSAEYIWDNLTLAGEFGENDYKYVMSTDFMNYGEIQSGEVTLRGWYGSIAYRFTDLFEAGYYYSFFTPTTFDRRGYSLLEQYGPGYPRAVRWSKDHCLSLKFDLTYSWVFKLEGHVIDGLAVMNIQDQGRNPDNTYDVEENWYLFAAKVTYSF